MTHTDRPLTFWFIVIFLILSMLMLVLGQTTSLFAYDVAVELGLQEPVEQVTAFGVEMNRAFGASDTVIYLPLIILSVVGLLLRKPWALLTTAAVMGISAYWSVTMASVLIFLREVPGFHLVPGVEYWIILGAYTAFGVWGITYVVLRGDKLVGGSHTADSVPFSTS